MPTVTLTEDPSATTEGVWYSDSFAGIIYPCAALWFTDANYFAAACDVDNDGVFSIYGRDYSFPNFQALGVVTITSFEVSVKGIYASAPLVAAKLFIDAYPSENSASGGSALPIIAAVAGASYNLTATATDVTFSSPVTPEESAQMINVRAGAQRTNFGVTINFDTDIGGTVFIDSFTYSITYEQGNSQQRQFLKSYSNILVNS